MATIGRATAGAWILHGSCVALAAWATFGAGAEDNLRCRNGKLVQVGMVAAEVKARCGEPTARDVEDVPVRARTPNGNVIVTGTTRLERWTYDRGPGQFDAVLSFDSDKLVSIDLLTGP
jgi:hypothetical protein